jgi:hypothetical protein
MTGRTVGSSNTQANMISGSVTKLDRDTQTRGRECRLAVSFKSTRPLVCYHFDHGEEGNKHRPTE